MDRWKAEQGRGREKRKIRREKVRRERVRRKKMRKSRNTVFFQWFVASEGRKVGLLKRRAAGAEPAGQMRDENVQNTPFLDHFWKLRCRKSARRCGPKHISKSKCTRHTIVGPLLEVEVSKKCTPLWREAHVQVKMYKTHHARTTFGSWDLEKVHAVVAQHILKSKWTKHHMFAPLLEVQMLKKCTPLWREAHFEVKMYKTPRVRAIFGASDVASLHYTTLHDTTLHYTPQHYNYNYTTTLHYTPLHSTTLHYTPLHSTTLHYTPLH